MRKERCCGTVSRPCHLRRPEVSQEASWAAPLAGDLRSGHVARSGDRATTGAYCRAPEVVFNSPFEVEHILPTARGGRDEEGNLCLACRACNLRKSDRLASHDAVPRADVPLFNPPRESVDRAFPRRSRIRRDLGGDADRASDGCRPRDEPSAPIECSTPLDSFAAVSVSGRRSETTEQWSPIAPADHTGWNDRRGRKKRQHPAAVWEIRT
jgi:5-methylcytosine-specific restriction endonuclease McrA